MFRRKMTEQELRMWCIEKSTHDAQIFWKQAETLYKYITEAESMAVQKKPHGHFFSHLWSWIRNLLK